MIKVKCRYCDYKVKKPRWEHIIHTIRKQGGDILKNVCPGCKKKGLELDWGEIMRMEEIIKFKDIDTYRKLMRIRNKKGKIRLGDKDAYKRVRGALRQIRWG